MTSPVRREALEAVRDALWPQVIHGYAGPGARDVAAAIDRALGASSAPQAVSSDGSDAERLPSSTVPESDAQRAFYHLRALVRLNREKAHVLQVPETGFYDQTFPSDTSFLEGLRILANRAGMDVPEECREIVPPAPEATGEGAEPHFDGKDCGCPCHGKSAGCPYCNGLTEAAQQRASVTYRDKYVIKPILNFYTEVTGKPHSDVDYGEATEWLIGLAKEARASLSAARQEGYEAGRRDYDAKYAAKLDRVIADRDAIDGAYSKLIDRLRAVEAERDKARLERDAWQGHADEMKAARNDLRSQLHAVEDERDEARALVERDEESTRALRAKYGARDDEAFEDLMERLATEARADAQWNEAIEAAAVAVQRESLANEHDEAESWAPDNPSDEGYEGAIVDAVNAVRSLKRPEGVTGESGASSAGPTARSSDGQDPTETPPSKVPGSSLENDAADIAVESVLAAQMAKEQDVPWSSPVSKERPVVCEFCYRDMPAEGFDTWRLVWQSWVCPACDAKVKARPEGYREVPGGAFAEGRPDPRGAATRTEQAEKPEASEDPGAAEAEEPTQRITLPNCFVTQAEANRRVTKAVAKAKAEEREACARAIDCNEVGVCSCANCRALLERIADYFRSRSTAAGATEGGGRG